MSSPTHQKTFDELMKGTTIDEMQARPGLKGSGKEVMEEVKHAADYDEDIE